jgi:hypothetical protein
MVKSPLEGTVVMLARLLSSLSQRLPAVLVFTALVATASVGSAVPVVWSSNGHSYSFVPLSYTVTWTAANAMAEAMTLSDGSLGYLASITSAEEQAFVQASVLPPAYDTANYNQVWLGGRQALGQTDPSAGWSWTNSGLCPECWDYTNWTTPGEPNDDGGINERFLTMWAQYLRDGRDFRGTWNDSDDLANINSRIIGMVVEWKDRNSAPEPGTAALAALGMGLLALRGRRSR